MWSGLHWMSLCVIPRALDGLLSSKVTLIIPISLNRALCLWRRSWAETGGIKQVCVSKKFDILLFLTGRWARSLLCEVYLQCWTNTNTNSYLAIDFYLIKSLLSQPQRKDALKLLSLLNSINRFVVDCTSMAAWLARRQVMAPSSPHVGQ